MEKGSPFSTPQSWLTRELHEQPAEAAKHAGRRASNAAATTSAPAPVQPQQRQGGMHVEAAALLVERYLGNGAPLRTDANIVSAEGALRRGVARQNLLKRVSFELCRPGTSPADAEAAVICIQKSFRQHLLDRDVKQRAFSRFGDEAVELIRRYTAGPGAELYQLPIASAARLVLHFDINKTVLMADRAQGANSAAVVNMLLSECAWGRLEAGPQWVPVGRLATDRPANDPQLMSYRSYLDSFLLPFRAGHGPEVERHNTNMKNQRQAFKRKFTEPGEPGHMFRGVYEQLKAALQLPAECVQKGKALGGGMRALFASGERHLLPSFFHLLRHMHAQGREFTLVFRTFGADVAEVVEELNAFATGQHPCYPEVRMDGSHGCGTDLRMAMPASTGAFFRSSSKQDGTMLLMGAPAEVMNAKALSAAALRAAESSGAGTLLESFRDIHHEIHRRAGEGNRALALRDYYPFWKHRNERSRAGKLLLLDPDDHSTIQIFFDDNIGHTAAHIVDARDVRSGEPLAFKDLAGRHVFKVEPLNAILDPQYFVRAVHGCVMAVLRERSQAPRDSAAENGGIRLPPSDGVLQANGGSLPPQMQQTGGGASTPGPSTRRPHQVANTSRRARELWSIVNDRLVAMIRVRNAIAG